jgi:3-deoxy-D-glycero-D-galacto-nononate 9-phosphate synthase
MLSPGDGFKWAERHKVIGKIVKESISENEIIYSNNITS